MIPCSSLFIYVSHGTNIVPCIIVGSSVHEILQSRILEWAAIPFSRGSSSLRDRTQAAALQVNSLLPEPPGKPSYW